MRLNWTLLVVSWLLAAATVYLQSRHFSGLGFLLDLPWSSFLTEAADIRRPRGAVDSSALLAGWLALNALWTALSLGLLAAHSSQRRSAEKAAAPIERVAPAVGMVDGAVAEPEAPSAPSQSALARGPAGPEGEPEAPSAPSQSALARGPAGPEGELDKPAKPEAPSAPSQSALARGPASPEGEPEAPSAPSQSALARGPAGPEGEPEAPSAPSQSALARGPAGPEGEPEAPSAPSQSALARGPASPEGEPAKPAEAAPPAVFSEILREAAASVPTADSHPDSQPPATEVTAVISEEPGVPAPRSLEALAEQLASAPGLPPEAREELRRLQSALEKLGRS